MCNQKDIEAIQKTINDVQDRIAIANSDLDRLKLHRARLACPFKKGEFIVIRGFMYKGKRGVVQSIEYPSSDEAGVWQVTVGVLNADGCLGTKVAIITQAVWNLG